MLTKKEIDKFRSYLKKSENPLIFYDDDPDGLCSYLILKKYIQKGKGAVLKTTSSLDLKMFHKIEEYSPDLVIILDIPIVAQDFIDKINVPILWLDHHPILKRKGVHYFNPKANQKEGEVPPTTYLMYKITEEKELFLGTLGSIADWHIPEYAKEFSEKYPDILPKHMKAPPEIIVDSKLGDLIKVFALILKNPTSKVNKAANLLLKIEDPYEILEEKTPRAKYILKLIQKQSNEYNKVMEEINKEKPTKEKLYIVELPKTNNAYTAIISNYLIYKYPKKVIMVKRVKEDEVIMSLRSTDVNIREALEKSLENLDGFGGGHDHACGAGIKKYHFEEFIEKLKENIK